MEWLVALFAERVLFWIPLLLSLTVHEYAHAWSATFFGDRTAEAEGRLTLDPVVHVDPIGTVLLPLLGVPFGWARPVPVNPANFRGGGDGRLAMLFTAAAGPLSNLGIALGCAGGATLLRAIPNTGSLTSVLASACLLNVTLAVLNLIPLPPLDGSRIVDWLCPDALRPAWNWIYARSGIGIALVLIVPSLLGMPLMSWTQRLADWMLGL